MSADGHPGAQETTWHHRVSYGETDAMGHAYYGEYMHWFEQARSQLIRERGMSYALVEERGLYLPVAEAGCRYRRPVRFDQEIAVQAVVSAWGRASCTFSYRVTSQETLVAEGSTRHACVDKTGRPVAMPDWLRRLFD